MFQGCKSLTSFSIPGNIETIGRNAFEGSGLTAINIPLNVKTIEGAAFHNCQSLKTVSIPSSVENFGDLVFVRCNNITTLRIHNKHKDLRKMVDIFGSDCQMFTSENLDECPGISWFD